ncbi:MAG: tetratricopeptide repeat protein [Deltaproteobacteria bacterium]|nr:tetratricopeptide repeat protein [Deltaproteobacteria bacterium]
MSQKIPKGRAARMLEQARLHLHKEEPGKALPLLEELYAAGALPGAAVVTALGEAHFQAGHVERALEVWRATRSLHPGDAGLLARSGTALLRLGRLEEALGELAAAEKAAPRDPLLLGQLGYALLVSGRPSEAVPRLQRGLQAGGGPELRLWLGHALARQGRYADAEAHLSQLAQSNKVAPAIRRAARTAWADCRLFMGDARGALERWTSMRQEGALEPAALGHMAYAAQLAGEGALAEALMAERLASGATAEDRLLFAQVANLRGAPARALELLEAVPPEPDGAGPGFAFECLLTKARALRLLGRSAEAQAVLDGARERPEAGSARLAAQLFVDLGHLAAGNKDFQAAREAFGRALELDAGDPEAKQGLASLEAAAPAPPPSAEALQRRISARDEVEALRAELEQLRAARAEAQAARERAEAQAREAQTARQQAESRSATALSEEMAARAQDVAVKAARAVDEALGEAKGRCPRSLVQALEVAERTWQQALYTDLPPAAVGVLYTGVLERALYLLLVEAFRGWLAEGGRLRPFLDGATRERRGKRVEYFDHFVEAFDDERPGRAPSLGEVQRALERRGEPYLQPWRAFLDERFGLPEERWDALAAFVRWSKLTLRDPVAHGRTAELDWTALKRFRAGLLESLEGMQPGALGLMLAQKR